MWRSFAIGVVAGSRSQLPSALLAWRANRDDLPGVLEGPSRLLRQSGSVPLTTLAAAGELVGDKLPMTPSRLDRGPLVGRLVLGAGGGFSLAGAFGNSRVLGALLGAAGAAIGAYGGYHLRKLAGERTPVPDAAWAVLEDGVAIGLGLRATRPAGATGDE